MNALDVFADARPDVEVDEGALDAIAAELFDGVPRRSGNSGRWRLLAVAAAVVALVAGLAVVVGRPAAPPPADTVPPVPADDAEPLAMLPADVSQWRITGKVTEPIDAPVLPWSAVIARPDGNGGYDWPLTVTRGPAETTMFRAGGFESDSTSEPVGLGEERRGELVTDPAGAQLIVQFELGDGTAVSVTTRYREPLTGERARALRVAANVAFPRGDEAEFRSLPDGFAIVAPWERQRVNTSRWASFTAADEDAWYSVSVVSNPDPVAALRGMGDVVVPVEVRGISGFLSTGRVGPANVDVRLIWQERPGQWVTVHDAAETSSTPELLAFAESLRVVSPEEWDRVVEPLDDDAGTSATTAPWLPDDGEPLRMLPLDVDGLELTGFLSGRAPSMTVETVLARPLADGTYVDKVVVRRGPKDDLWFETRDVAEQGEIEITALSTLGWVWDVVTAGPSVVFAQTDMGDGTAMQVSVDTTSYVERSRDAVVAVATSLGNSRVQPPQGVTFDPLPAGFEMVTDVGAFDPWTRFLLVEGNDLPVLQVATYASDDPDLAFRLMAEDLRPVTVRGVAGFASTMLRAQKVMWKEAPGQWVVVQSDAGPTTADELIAFAETLRVVSPDEWDAVVQLPAGWEPGYPATTLPAPANTAPAPVASTTPPATTAP